jgi:hypothetical protein
MDPTIIARRLQVHYHNFVGLQGGVFTTAPVNDWQIWWKCFQMRNQFLNGHFLSSSQYAGFPAGRFAAAWPSAAARLRLMAPK